MTEAEGVEQAWGRGEEPALRARRPVLALTVLYLALTVLYLALIVLYVRDEPKPRAWSRPGAGARSLLCQP